MAAISRMLALSVVIKIFGPNNPFRIQTMKGLCIFPLSVLKTMSAPTKTQLQSLDLAKDFGLQSPWTGSSLESRENCFRQGKTCQALVGQSLDPIVFIVLNWGTCRVFGVGHFPSEITQVDTGYSPGDTGGGFRIMPVYIRWKYQQQQENCALVLMHTSNHLSLLSISFCGLRNGSFLVPARLGFKLRCFVCVCGGVFVYVGVFFVVCFCLFVHFVFLSCFCFRL